MSLASPQATADTPPPGSAGGFVVAFPARGETVVVTGGDNGGVVGLIVPTRNEARWRLIVTRPVPAGGNSVTRYSARPARAVAKAVATEFRRDLAGVEWFCIGRDDKALRRLERPPDLISEPLGGKRG